ncbi:type II/IV secretion system ATPase subunit [Haloarcula marismortui]|jgi:flagellar protein FlaI|uniref:Type IV pilus biogenesis complex ATPase subunit n=1 Tax=Haloarcula marismortui ATCC 33799 TaxID=662475 RepID=M0KHL6_9EURY|nr:type II/IV secretion system ATPase subunit [Haloarcula californiae]EMA20661.1 type IV pilus biogenesis complex ATPase subunit [Haloarcula californiae ATCC 33799]
MDPNSDQGPFEDLTPEASIDDPVSPPLRPKAGVSDRRDNTGEMDAEPLEETLGVELDVIEDELGDDIELWENPFVSDILSDVGEYFATNTDAEFVAPPSSEFIAARFFDFAFLEEYELVEYRWVQKPYAFIAIVYDEQEMEHRYLSIEPEMNSFEGYVRQDMIELLRNQLMYKDFEQEGDRRELFEREAKELILDNAATVEEGSLHKLLYYLVRDFIDYGGIDPIMRDPAVEDISCDGAGVPVFVYHREYRDVKSNVSFDREALDSFTSRMAQRAGKQLTISNPLVDASLPNGSRVQITLGGDISTRGSNFTIRKFADIPFTPVDLIRWNTFSAEMMAYYWIAIQNNKSLVFAGGTGSGKTSSMNAISFFIPPASKIVSIEDTREIDLPQENWIQSVTRSPLTSEGRGEISMYNLLNAALRQRPEYLLVGEIRTDENVALTFFQAMSTGHTAYTTFHADTVETVISRMQNPPLNVPVQMLRDLDIISVQQQTYIGDKRVRRNHSTSEVLQQDYDLNDVQTKTVFKRDASADTHEKVTDSTLLQEIATDRGWSDTELQNQIENRVQLLQYMADERITGYVEVASAIQLFDKNTAETIRRVESGTLTAEFLRNRGPSVKNLESMGVDRRTLLEGQ